jgi:hypothetical protein
MIVDAFPCAVAQPKKTDSEEVVGSAGLFAELPVLTTIGETLEPLLIKVSVLVGV